MSAPSSPWNTTGPALTLGDELRPGAPERERAGEPARAAWDRLVAAGLTDVLYDRASGGPGGTLSRAAEDVFAVAGGDLVGALLLAGHHAAVGTLLAAGDAAAGLRERAFREGRLLSPALPGATALGFTTGGGTAIRVGGVAAEVHGAGEALGLVVAARDGEGASWLAAVPVERPGIVVEELGLRTGLRRLPAGRAQFLDTALEAGEAVRVPADRDPAAIGRGLRAVLEAAAIAGVARGNIEAAAALTRLRERPRPVPGATNGITDPIGQVIGEGLGPVDAAHALALAAAAEYEAALRPDAEVDAEALLVRALAAIDVAIGVGLEQGERVYEVVGTSGSGNKHGFDALWRDVRTLSLAWPRAERRRAVGRAYLETAR